MSASLGSGLLATAYWIAAGLLMLAGAAKIRNPQTASAFFQRARVFMPSTLAVILGGVELLAGFGCLAFGWAPATIVGTLLYASFVIATLWLLLRGGPGATCACLGVPDTPITAAHIAVNVLLLGGMGAHLVDGHAPTPLELNQALASLEIDPDYEPQVTGEGG